MRLTFRRSAENGVGGTHNQHTAERTQANSPIQSYRYTVAMFPLPYKNVLRYRTRPNVGGISILASNAYILPRAVLRIGLWHPPPFIQARQPHTQDLDSSSL
jgi:hypothetical protein